MIVVSQRLGNSTERQDGALQAFAIARSGEAGAAEELSQQLLSWSYLWASYPQDGEMCSKHLMVRERLVSWLERCIGRKARSLFGNRAEDLSLATSTPLLVAFLGRRATRELSRKVLGDL